MLHRDKLRRPQPETTLLAVIDVQTKLIPAMEAGLRTRLIDNLKRLGAARKILELETVLTEQYPKGLGPTTPEVMQAFEGVTPREKVAFDAFEDDSIRELVARKSPATVVVAGMETHICVFQSVRSLREHGHRVFVLEDAVASRTTENHRIGLELAREAGAVITSTETVLFDLLRRAGSDAFRAISKLVR